GAVRGLRLPVARAEPPGPAQDHRPHQGGGHRPHRGRRAGRHLRRVARPRRLRPRHLADAMNLVKKQLPLLIGMAVGVLVLAQFSVPASWLDVTREELLTFAQILAAAAFVLGGVNLIQVNYPKIRRREEDWQYKVVLLAGAAIMFAVGFPWQDIGENPSPGQVTVVDGAAAASGGAALLRVEATRDNALVKVDGGSPQRAVVDGRPLELELQPGAHTIHVYMPAVGYGELRTELEV